MKFFTNCIVLCVLISVALSACEEKATLPAVDNNIQEIPKTAFAFYKNLEIRPGLNFEVISWGKQADSVGGMAILLSDSLKRSYRAITIARKGVISDAWNLDLDTDGNPEIYLQIVQNKNQSDLMVYEYDDNEFQKISFPSLSDKTLKIFQGNDKFFIKGGQLFRSIPVRDGKEGVQRSIEVEYLLRGNTFDIREVK